MDGEIRFAMREDTPRIMRFIDEHWKRGHILSRDRDLFEWQYGGAADKIHMVLGLRDDDLLGVLGFVPYDDTDGKDLALALWKAMPGESFLGIRLLMYLKEHEPHRNIVCPGINMGTTGGIYRRMGMSTGRMRQWYRLNPEVGHKIARVVNEEVPRARQGKGRIVELRTFGQFLGEFDFESAAYRGSVPFKSPGYVKWRYFHHPAYAYLKYGMEIGGKIEAVAILRMQERDGSRAARVTDVIGDVSLLPEFTPFFDDCMRKAGAEYIDLYEAGLPDSCLIDGGWLGVEGSGNVIPNYFAPYLAENIDIYYSSSCDGAVIFRGDGDQDRPN